MFDAWLAGGDGATMLPYVVACMCPIAVLIFGIVMVVLGCDE